MTGRRATRLAWAVWGVTAASLAGWVVLTGLQGMADRLEAIGGTLQIRSASNRGTTVTGRVPVPVRVDGR